MITTTTIPIPRRRGSSGGACSTPRSPRAPTPSTPSRIPSRTRSASPRSSRARRFDSSSSSERFGSRSPPNLERKIYAETPTPSSTCDPRACPPTRTRTSPPSPATPPRACTRCTRACSKKRSSSVGASCTRGWRRRGSGRTRNGWRRSAGRRLRSHASSGWRCRWRGRRRSMGAWRS